jgi:signal transduction histidine kinase
VSAQQAGSHLEVRVRDSGIGIRPDFLAQVFERFSQVDGSSSRSHAGLGLGLAIVRHLVELHGGLVWAESEGEGKGAVFTVALPIRAVFPPVLPDVLVSKVAAVARSQVENGSSTVME